MHNSTTLVTCPIHAILLNATARRGQFLIDNVHTLVGILHVCCALEKLEEVEGAKDENIFLYRLTSSNTVPLKSGVRICWVNRERTTDETTSQNHESSDWAICRSMC